MNGERGETEQHRIGYGGVILLAIGLVVQKN